MHTSTRHRADRLSVEERHVVERLLGRALDENEFVEVSAERGRIIKEAATGAEREAAVRDMQELLARIDERSAAEPEEELDAIVEEAIAQARRRR